MSAIYSVDSPVNGALPKADLPDSSPPASGNTDAATGSTPGTTDALTAMLDASTATNTPNTEPKPTAASATDSTPLKTAGTDLATVVNGKTTPPPSKAEVAMDALVRRYAGLAPADQDNIEGTLSLATMRERADQWNRTAAGRDPAARGLASLLSDLTKAKDPDAFLAQNKDRLATANRDIGLALERRRGFEAKITESGPTKEIKADPTLKATPLDEAEHQLNILFRVAHGGELSRPDAPLDRLVVYDKNVNGTGSTYADRQLSTLINDFKVAKDAGRADAFLKDHGDRFAQVEQLVYQKRNGGAGYAGFETSSYSVSHNTGTKAEASISATKVGPSKKQNSEKKPAEKGDSLKQFLLAFFLGDLRRSFRV